MIAFAVLLIAAWYVWRVGGDESSGDGAETQQPKQVEDAAAAALRTDAVNMAMALRRYDPMVVEADDAARSALDCVGGNPRDLPERAKQCADTLSEGIAALQARLPNPEDHTGCARTVSQAAASVVAALKSRAESGGIWDTGVDFGSYRELLKECAKNFTCSDPFQKPSGPCAPEDLEHALGLRGGATDRLWLADGREVDTQTLRLK